MRAIPDEFTALPEPGTFPADPDFPQLKIATDPERMLDVFRKHLRPISPDSWRIQECVPFRFRIRQGSSRCVLQYTLHMVKSAAGSGRFRADRVHSQWATAFLYAGDGQARRLCQEHGNYGALQEIPDAWLTFEPVCFVPELQMLVTLFPYDRKLHALARLMGGPPPDLEALLLARFGPGDWRIEHWEAEPVRYRAELQAVVRYTGRAREARTGVTATRRFYVKVLREQRSEQILHLLPALSAAAERNGFSIAPTVAYLAALHTVVLDEAPGISLQDIFLEGGDGVAASTRVARAVAAFNQSDLAATRPYPLEEQRMQVSRSAQVIGWACPHLRRATEQIAAAIVAGLEEVPLAPIHRDLKPDHIFLENDHVTFVDLDNLSLADPVMDTAHLMSYIITRVGLDSVPFEKARSAVRVLADEYCAHVPVSWRRRLPTHYAAALIEVAVGIFRHQDPRWEEKIGRAVEEAQCVLSGGLR